MAALLGLVTGVLAFIPNIGAITSGVLMVAVGFSAGPSQGLWAIFVYFFVQNIDGYLVVPYIARRTVDLPPALVLAMQLLMGALFGILGVLFADPILATMKVVLVDVSKQQAAREGEQPEGRRLGLSPHCCGGAPLHQRGVGNQLHDMDVELEVRVGRDRPARGRLMAVAELGRDVDLVAAAFLHLGKRLGEAGDGLAGEDRNGAFAGARIEHLAVLEASFIVDQDAVLGRDQRPASRSDGFDLDGAAAHRLGADPGKPDSGRDDDQEREPQLDRPAGVGGSVRGFGDGHAFVGG